MNLGYNQQSYPQRNQQANAPLSVPAIPSSQVWIGLSEPQQQMVATTVTKICQALAQCCPQEIVSEGGIHERVH